MKYRGVLKIVVFKKETGFARLLFGPAIFSAITAYCPPELRPNFPVPVLLLHIVI